MTISLNASLRNLVGSQFWQQLCQEHGINQDGNLEDFATEGGDRKDVFFYQVENSSALSAAQLLIYAFSPTTRDTSPALYYSTSNRGYVSTEINISMSEGN